MSKEEKWNYDIENIKRDFEIENIIITEDDIELIRKYYNKEVSLSQLINIIKKSILKGVK